MVNKLTPNNIRQKNDMQSRPTRAEKNQTWFIHRGALNTPKIAPKYYNFRARARKKVSRKHRACAELGFEITHRKAG